jgi:ABC-type transport system substrate-binding protein
LIGIIPAHLSASSISSSPVGTGPYQFSKALSDNNQTITEVDLERSDTYYGQKPYISNVDFQITDDETQAKNDLSSWFSPATAVAGLNVKDNDISNYSYATSRDFGLVFNLNNAKFKDVNVRKKIASTEKFSPSISFSLLVMDKPLSVSTAQSLQSQYAKRGINISIDKEDAVDYNNLLTKRNYQSVLYGFDSGYDRDPYPFWHSSQIQSGDNFSGFSDKSADILLENARMTTDSTARNQLYNQFFAILSDQVPVIFLPPQTFDFSVKSTVQGITGIKGYEPWDHLNGFANWYLKTKRVKP